MFRKIQITAVTFIMLFSFSSISSADDEVVMDNQRLGELIKRIDESAQGKPGYWQFIIEGREVTVITAEKANRMRIIVPIAPASKLSKEKLTRMMQANFDSALDARYSIAKDIVWAAFIHPLRELGDEEFLSGVGQAVNLALTYGEGYSSGALIFGGGDSQSLRRRELIDRLLEKGTI
ncbi:MAG: hypothetical protein KAT25_07485 [Sulfuriflexus sp.]|nr:hypothetical protein [Sulfuriflexus sp.]